MFMESVEVELEKMLKNIEATETEFFAKDYEKSKILSKILETKLRLP